MRPTKERGVKGNPVLDKLMKLKYRINDAYNHRQEMVDAREKSLSQGWHNVTVVKPNRSNS